MIYLLEVLALLGIAVALAASPFLIRLLESIVPPESDRGRSMAHQASPGAASRERAEMHEEIRRATYVLETQRRSAGRFPAQP